METTAPVPTIRRLSTVQRIALTIGAVVVVWMASPLDLQTTVLFAVMGLLLLGFRKPLWAMAALLVSQLTVTSYMLPLPVMSISLRLFLLIVIGVILWRSSASVRIDFGAKAKRTLIPAAILIGLILVANLVNSGFDFAFKDFRGTAVGLMILLFLPAVVNKEKDLKLLSTVLLVGVTASAIVGVMQYIGILGLAESTLRSDYYGLVPELRVPGMAETELELSYVLAAAIPVMIAVYFTKGLERNTALLVLLSAAPVGLALYFTYTRSALFALLLGLLALAVFLKSRIRGEVVLIALLVGIGFIAWSGFLDSQYLGGRSEAAQDESTVSREIVWQAGIAMGQDHPIFGIGGDQFKTMAPRYASSVDPALLAWEEEQYWGYASLGSVEIHNDFLMVWVSYGTGALLAYLWLFVVIMQNFLDSHASRSSSRFVKGLSIGLAAALVVYGANAFYHNCFVALPLIWIIAGLSLATAKLAFASNREA